jgi:hypothetical protein
MATWADKGDGERSAFTQNARAALAKKSPTELCSAYLMLARRYLTEWTEERPS